ncbi:TPA: flagellar biosynthesis protein FlgA [Candidatus Woesearchaeota archaeon]|nr:flagellar biosynthesis protein FlgA [Candidatus Woesearchaeota archaeon]HII68546.1 flagellar biosynthesis protein FlgA [Candidatus Woesearchaeota archaeon]
MRVKVGEKYVGDGGPFYTVAEIGSNFDGSYERAKKLIYLAKKAGADAVKFQCFTPDKIVSREGFEGLKMGFQAKWSKPVFEVYKDAEFPREWNKGLFDYCKQIGITYFSTPYDYEAADLLDSLGIPAFKIGSGDITWLDFLSYVAKKGKPVILGTGASTMQEIREAVHAIKSSGNEQLILLQCVTNYPASFDDANIRAMVKLKEAFTVPVGYSDHTPGDIVALGTLALGGCMIEKHFTDDKNRHGPDHPFAMDFSDFKKMVDDVRLLEKALGTEKKELYNEEKETVILQRRCVRAAKDIAVGIKISQDMLTVLRPAPEGSLPPKLAEHLVGRKSAIFLKKGEIITLDMVK